VSLIDQLLEFYYKHDQFQTKYVSEERARQIYQNLLDRGRIHSYLDNSGSLLGYGESFRITYEQFGRIICGQNFYKHIEDEDIEHGNIAYIANVCIRPEWRRTQVIRILRNDFFQRNYMCDYFCGIARHSNSQPVKVFSKNEAFMKWCKEAA